MNEKESRNFWIKVDKGGPNECWVWTASKKVKGYGQFGINRKNHFAHRLSWEIHNGSIPPGMCVLHRCDNMSCVNPAHLFLGTKEDNVADMVAKGRQARGKRTGAYTRPERIARGERVGTSKLSEQDVSRIRFLYTNGGVTQQELAQQFGVHQSNISVIVSGKNWKHLK